jgi:hypothetical protein
MGIYRETTDYPFRTPPPAITAAAPSVVIVTYCRIYNYLARPSLPINFRESPLLSSLLPLTVSSALPPIGQKRRRPRIKNPTRLRLPYQAGYILAPWATNAGDAQLGAMTSISAPNASG